MNPAFKKIFWGFIFVLIEIHIFIDFLPEPVGYFLIFSGASLLAEDFKMGHIAKNLSIVLLIFSIPSVFIQNNVEFPIVSLWYIYFLMMQLGKIILVFYIFKLIMEFVKEHGDKRIIERSSKTFTIYLITMLTLQIMHSFLINFSNDAAVALTVFSIVVALIMEIVFLVLIRAVGKQRL